MYEERKKIYSFIEKARNTKVIAYVTGDRKNLETQIGDEVPDIFIEHLDAIGNVKKMSLLLYTRGGDTLAAWSIVNLIREYCEELEIIVPNKCRSAGTLISLGANNIVMTKHATLGPIDPSIVREMSPIIPNSNPPRPLPISVESVKGYVKLLKEEFGVVDEKSISDAYIKLVEKIHPVVLGDVYRIQKQIQMLAKKLLQKANYSEVIIDKIIRFLCTESGSHNYTINYTEAKDLGLNVEKPSNEINNELKKWYNDVSDELELKKPYEPINELKDKTEFEYSFKRCLIESIDCGQDIFISEGKLKKVNQQNLLMINDDKNFEGWRHTC